LGKKRIYKVLLRKAELYNVTKWLEITVFLWNFFQKIFSEWKQYMASIVCIFKQLSALLAVSVLYFEK